MGKITDYPKVTDLVQNNVMLLDGDNGTKGILAGDLGNALLSLMTAKEIMDNVNIADLDAASTLEWGDSLLVNTATGNKKITLSDAVYGMLDPVIPVEARRNLWRGRGLGYAVTDEQYNEIGAGTFRGLFLGDYWIIGDRKWRIVDFNYWLHCGDDPDKAKTTHLVIMPDEGLYRRPMNTTDSVEGGYVGSEMYTDGLTEAKTIINGAFGAEHILNHREFLVNAVTNNKPTGGAWLDSTVELPTEAMMYGCRYYSVAIGSDAEIRTVGKVQLAGMQAYPPLIQSTYRNTQWLRDIGPLKGFCVVMSHGFPYYGYSSGNQSVRPVFGIKK